MGRRRKENQDYKEILHNYLGGGSRWNTKLLCVHHINHNHSDNDEHNLLLMPIKMHSRYHYLYSVAMESCLLKKDLDGNFSLQRHKLEEFIAIKDDMCTLSMIQSEVHDISRKSLLFEGKQIDGVGRLLCYASKIYNKYL